MTTAGRLESLDKKIDRVLEVVTENGKLLARHSVRIAHLEQGDIDADTNRSRWVGYIVGALGALLAAGCGAGITYVIGG